MHTLAYDSRKQKVLLFGGYRNSIGTTLNDTWEWDSTGWTQVADIGPSSRAGHSMAYDETRKKMVLFGGFDNSLEIKNDTWEWDGNEWLQVADIGPEPRTWAPLAYDSQK